MTMTLNKAAQAACVSKSTLSEAIKTGRLSAPKDDKNRYMIDPAELFRVFPKTSLNEQTEPIPNTEKDRPNSALQVEVDALKRELETERKEREREREQMTEQVEDLRRRLDEEATDRRQTQARLADLNDKMTKPPAPVGFWAGLFGKGKNNAH